MASLSQRLLSLSVQVVLSQRLARPRQRRGPWPPRAPRIAAALAAGARAEVPAVFRRAAALLAAALLLAVEAPVQANSAVPRPFS